MLVILGVEQGNIFGVSAFRVIFKREVTKFGALVQLTLEACLVLLTTLKIKLLLLVRELIPKLANQLLAL